MVEITELIVLFNDYNKEWEVNIGTKRVYADRHKPNAVKKARKIANAKEPSTLEIYTRQHRLSRKHRYGLKRNTKRS